MVPKTIAQPGEIPLPDFLDVDRIAAAERSYRKGFMQGAAKCARLMRNGYTLADLERWIYDDHNAWRYHKAGGHLPPAPGDLAEVWR